MTKKDDTINTNLIQIVSINFIILKLTGLIHWSWWWVTSPIWGYVAIILVIAVLHVLLANIGRK